MTGAARSPQGAASQGVSDSARVRAPKTVAEIRVDVDRNIVETFGGDEWPPTDSALVRMRTLLSALDDVARERDEARGRCDDLVHLFSTIRAIAGSDRAPAEKRDKLLALTDRILGDYPHTEKPPAIKDVFERVDALRERVAGLEGALRHIAEECVLCARLGAQDDAERRAWKAVGAIASKALGDQVMNIFTEGGS